MSQQESRCELERIRELRDGESSEEQEVEILVCPVEGCSRTVVDEPANPIHHVRQAGDDSHRFKRLTEDLELVIDHEEHHAMWGPREGTDRSGPRARSTAITDW